MIGMKIEITADSAVADGKGNRYRRGQSVDVDDALAQSWIDAGHAVKAAGARTSSSSETAATDPATATNEPPRTTATRSTRKMSSE